MFFDEIKFRYRDLICAFFKTLVLVIVVENAVDVVSSERASSGYVGNIKKLR